MGGGHWQTVLAGHNPSDPTLHGLDPGVADTLNHGSALGEGGVPREELAVLLHVEGCLRNHIRGPLTLFSRCHSHCATSPSSAVASGCPGPGADTEGRLLQTWVPEPGGGDWGVVVLPHKPMWPVALCTPHGAACGVRKPRHGTVRCFAGHRALCGCSVEPFWSRLVGGGQQAQGAVGRPVHSERPTAGAASLSSTALALRA